jgi:K+-sensing histidine kinase KdpD
MVRNLTVESHLENVTIAMNEELVEILLNNLLSNATRHNCNGGRITISLNKDIFFIANTSKAPALNKDTLYQRFTKINGNNDNNGLGLSIIRQICDSSGMNIKYEFKNEMHIFSIYWN